MKPLGIDLFCGLGGWTEGLLLEGFYVVGFDIERREYGDEKYPGELVIQDVLTLHGSQFKDAALIVASPPCQAYSYRAMPWKRAKALPPPDNSLFDACFRIQREACEAAGRHVPMVVENVRGAQKWVGRAKWHYGSFYLWGDVPALMPIARPRAKVPGLDWSKHGEPGYAEGPGRCFRDSALDPRLGDGMKVGDAGWRERGPGRQLQDRAIKNTDGSWFNIPGPGGKVAGRNPDGRKGAGGSWLHGNTDHPMRRGTSKGASRKRASALIAKIPLRLSRYIAATYKPTTGAPLKCPA